ncbi:uncharacterized protein LOC143186683 [Calliopsis andreniformis]|uniref:uncharacterized protein LOC143186683 n=1 Tax=Calliopsis andreniformis TaxID=337506 RepID=UPI003FCE2120
MVPSDEVNYLSKRLMKYSLLSSEITKTSFMAANKQERNYNHQNSLFGKKYKMHGVNDFSKPNGNLEPHRNKSLIRHLNNPNSQLHQISANYAKVDSDLNAFLLRLSDLSRKEKWRFQHIFKKKVQKRSAFDEADNRKKGLSKGKQRKVKALGHLLQNNISNKSKDDPQDDYIDDDDDTYWNSVNRKKMNWEDYQNQDGASIMELIALNTRHKTYMRDKYFY